MPATTYTAADMVTIVAALGVLTTAVGAVIVNVVVALRTTHKVDETARKTDDLKVAVQEVHTLTNANLSAVKTELAAARVQIESLVALVSDLKSEREKVAVRTALLTPVPRSGTDERRSNPHLDAIKDKIGEHDGWERDERVAVQTALDKLDAKVTTGGAQLDTIEETVVDIDAKISPPRGKGHE